MCYGRFSVNGVNCHGYMFTQQPGSYPRHNRFLKGGLSHYLMLAVTFYNLLFVFGRHYEFLNIFLFVSFENMRHELAMFVFWSTYKKTLYSVNYCWWFISTSDNWVPIVSSLLVLSTMHASKSWPLDGKRYRCSRLVWMKIAFIITRKRNNVVVSFGTLKVQSFMLTEVRDCDLLIVVTLSLLPFSKEKTY